MEQPVDLFRLETRQWLQDNCPQSIRKPGFVPWGSSKIKLDEDSAHWLSVMSVKGWTVPTWPEEYGGAGLNKEQYLVIQQEMQRIGARPALTGRGINYIGPTVLEFGSDEQKSRWLPKFARGEGGWCMGYSEPEAGSDLANLKLRAEEDGDNYRLNGMKIWTSDGLYGDWIFCLVRTDPNKSKHEGISLVLVNMEQPGVRVRPIKLISGNSPFCETFFEDAIAKKSDLIGGVNQGWGVGKRLLQYERSVHGGVNTSGAQAQEAKSSLLDLAKRYLPRDQNTHAQQAFRNRLLRLEMNNKAYKLTQRRVIAETQAAAPALATSILKVKGAEFSQERVEVQQALMGIQGCGWEGDQFSSSELALTREWLTSRAISIYGGTSEIQKNIIAKRVLGLPD
ncbi:MAG: acyl-CoA dehydrogenase [Gammaproteobacteria bacterium]|jgi:alkylation response protein AidB-like acyl-CoA dehydrogenase|nr:acyl-CoA dehydrogenase [Gammaproteobacteria bacterium]MBT5202645.1 acyl-CoA dehydrogenase [Gammaproteobacteria bacterium]MBT5603066.1 acyl-CoA dehydrogenase [Gammaproteobacteria bacterium]MBT6245326.1 acyl-CoA dehydrogenase [Gammaproteobacteria bacterium]